MGTQTKPPPPIPLSVLTGFLGAGKTTLLNALLKSPALADTAVLINEFGDIGLDHLLVRAVDAATVVLTTGCVCCTVRGELVDALEDLTRALDNGRLAFRRVVIETTGLADPAPVLHTIMAHPYLVMRYRLDGVVTVVDAVSGASTLDRHREAVKQAAVADRLVLTKTDLMTGGAARADLTALKARLHTLNPAALQLDAAAGEAIPERLFDCGLYDPAGKTPDVRRWLAEAAYGPHGHDREGHHDSHQGHHHTHDDRVRTLSFSTENAIPASSFDMFLDLLRSFHGPNLLRLKGIVKLKEHPDNPVVIHGVQHVFHPPAVLPEWPDGDRRTRLVVIAMDTDPAAIERLFHAFSGEVRPDTPDSAALTDSPLRPFGGADHH